MMETLKEAAKRLFPNEMEEYDIFLIGARLQQERSYSKEEVLDILYRFHYDLVNSNIDTKEEWFKQFKKK